MKFPAHSLFGKLFMYLLLPILLVILATGTFTYVCSTNALKAANEGQYLTLRKALQELAGTTYQMTRQRVESNLRTASAVLLPKLTVSDVRMRMDAIDQVTGKARQVDLPRMLLDGRSA